VVGGALASLAFILTMLEKSFRVFVKINGLPRSTLFTGAGKMSTVVLLLAIGSVVADTFLPCVDWAIDKWQSRTFTKSKKRRCEWDVMSIIYCVYRSVFGASNNGWPAFTITFAVFTLRESRLLAASTAAVAACAPMDGSSVPMPSA